MTSLDAQYCLAGHMVGKPCPNWYSPLVTSNIVKLFVGYLWANYLKTVHFIPQTRKKSIAISFTICEYKWISKIMYFKSQILVHEYYNTRSFWRPNIIWFWMPPARSKERYLMFSGHADTPEMFQYLPILGSSSIWDLKQTFVWFHHLGMSLNL